MAKAQTDKEPSEEKLPAEKELGGEDSKKPTHPQEGTTPRAGQRDQILYLFGRTGREKEEWFQRFILASKLKSEPKKPSGVSGAKPGNEWMVCQTHLWFKVLEASETCPGEREGGRREGMKKVRKERNLTVLNLTRLLLWARVIPGRAWGLLRPHSAVPEVLGSTLGPCVF